MTSHTRQTSNPPGRRPGFTLVELLVVIGIISVLVVILTSAASQVVATQYEKNTETNIKKLGSELEKQWKAVLDDVDKKPIPPEILEMAAGDPDRARIILRAIYLRYEFPVNYSEARSPVVYRTFRLPANKTYVDALAVANPPNPPVAAQSSACLLVALSKARSGTSAKFNPEEVLGPGTIKDTDNDGVNEIVDSWGTPLGFFRFPVNAAFTDTRSVLDPKQLLYDPRWNNNEDPQRKQVLDDFERLTGLIIRKPTEPNLGQPWRRHTEPVVASAGRNKQWGVEWRTLRSLNLNQRQDNLYSYKVEFTPD